MFIFFIWEQRHRRIGIGGGGDGGTGIGVGFNTQEDQKDITFRSRCHLDIVYHLDLVDH